MYSLLFVRVVFCVCLCLICITLCPFSCSNHLEEEDYVFIVSPMSCRFICSVALPHGAMGLSAVCYGGIY